MASPSTTVPRPTIHGGAPAFSERFRFIKPTLPDFQSVISAYQGFYAAGMITNGSLVQRLESAAAERLGVNDCVAVSSCTSGLMLLLRALRVTGEVILPSFTFFATGHAVNWNGLTPVFADCDPDTWTIDPDDVETRITERTTAIIAVHMYGNPCAVEALQAIATRHKLKLIFDSAHAFGSRRGGRPIGQFGDAEAFSLSPTKLLVAGEGGLVSTNDATLANSLRAGRNYGDPGSYDPDLIGLNARMPEFNAALALAGLAILDAKLARHNAIATRYTELLSSVRGLRFQKVAPADLCSYKDYSVCVDPGAAGITRDELASALLAENIETKKYFYPPMHLQKLYRGYHAGRPALPVTDSVSGSVLSLPIYESLSDETVEGVARAIQRLILYQAASDNHSPTHS